MSALYMDSFDQYGTGAAGVANMLDGVWASIPSGSFSVNPPFWGPSRTGLNCFQMTPFSSSNNARFVVPGSPKVMYMSFGFAVDFLPPFIAGNIFDIRDSANAIQYSIVLNPTGSISLCQPDSSAATLATTAGPVIRAQTWHFLEVKVDFTAGTLVLRVDDSDATGTPVLTHSINTTGTNGLIGMSWINTAGQNFGNWYYDDLFVRDSAGTANNSWLGDRRVALLLANADTATAGWTPRYYQKFGAGVLKVANMTTNSNVPLNQNACVSANGATSLDVGSADFTLESFVRFENTPAASNYSSIFSRWDALNNKRSYRLILGGSSFNNSCLQFDYSTDGTSSGTVTPIVFPWAPDLNTWYHIALVRASNELLLFVDGKQQGLPIPISATIFAAGTAPFNLGAESGTGGIVTNTYLIGMYDETRFTNGFARYTAPFAPPTAPFPRGLAGDPEWADVVLLSGYDSGVVDESSFARTLGLSNGAVSYIVNDGPGVGAFSTINKAVPDDNTFISAALTNATGILTMTTQPTANQTVTVGTTDGTTPAVYTWKTALTGAYQVLIDTTAENTLLNLFNAINAGAGIGTKYGTGTLANFNVSATQLPTGQIEVIALTAGTGGNSIATTSTTTAATWGGTTLSGGANIPGASRFKVQRPPANTTIISAIQLTTRAYKSDAGTCVMQNALVGPLGGVGTGSTHNLATNPGYYLDILEVDPDTSNPISPATIVNGQIQINRTA